MLDYSALHRQYGQRKETGAVQATAPVAQSGPIDYDALHRKYGQRTETQTQRSLGLQPLMAQKALESPSLPLAVKRSFNPSASQRILRQTEEVNRQIEAKKREVKSEARRVAQEQEEQKRAAGGYAAALGGTKKATDTNPIGSTYAAAYDAYQTPSQKAMAQKGAELGRLKDQQTALSKAYYETENEEQRARILKDKPMWGKYQGIQGLQDTLRVATAVAADAQNPGSGGEPGQIILAKERLAREYGITDEAIRNYALYGDDDSIPADGKYTNISQFIHQLEREQQALSDEMGDAGYDYNRMSKYQRRRIDHAEALVKADERRRAARENPALAAVGTMVVKPFQFVDYAGALLSGIGSSDPSDPKTYVPINTDTMDLTNAVNTVRGEQAKMAEEKWGKPGSFAYQTGMSMADFLFTSGVTGNFSGGGKAASNLALGIMGSSAAADTTVSALNRGLSNRQALTLGAIAGAAEIITEKVSLEKLLDMTSLSKSRVGYVLQNIIAEGSEEAASDVINWVADVLVSRDQSEWRLAIAAYQAQGMDEDTAFWHALGDQAVEIGVDFLGGAASGGIMAGGSVAIDAYQNRATGGWVNFIEGAKKPGEYRLNKPQNVEMPTVPIISLSVQDIPVQGDTLPTAGNVLRSDAIQRARARLGLDKNSAAYIPASNVMRDGNEYVLKITKASLTKMLSPSTQGAIPVESILVMDNLERIANNGVWFESEGDRRGRQQIAGIDHLKTTVYIDGAPFEVDMRVRLVEEAPGKGVDNVLYYFTPEEVLTIRRVGTTPPTYGRRASILHSEDGPTLGAGTASPTDERRALTGESETMPTPSDRVTQNPGGVNLRRSLPGDIPADIPPGLHGLYRLAQEMSASPPPREIPQRPVQQSPQEILTQLAREMAMDPQAREIPQRPAQSSGWDVLYRLAQKMAMDPNQRMVQDYNQSRTSTPLYWLAKKMARQPDRGNALIPPYWLGRGMTRDGQGTTSHPLPSLAQEMNRNSNSQLEDILDGNMQSASALRQSGNATETLLEQEKETAAFDTQDSVSDEEGVDQGIEATNPGVPVEIGTVDFSDKASIMDQLALAQKETEGLTYEVCYCVTADGKVWKVSGEAGTVDQSAISSSLAGAYSFHNHPKSKTWHSFSAEDVRSFFRNGEQLAKAADYLYEYTMERTEDTVDIDPDVVYHKFKEIYNREIKKMAWYGELDIDIDGFHETMRILSQELRFHYERKKAKTP